MCKENKERIIARRLLEHLRDNAVLSSTPHGFIPGHSTCTSLLETLHDWTLNVQNNHGVVVAYTDFSKAFDCVSTVKLLTRFSQCGVRSNAYCYYGYNGFSVTEHFRYVLVLEMCGNGFQHSHSLPFPSIQFPFPPIPIPNCLTYSHSHGIPVWAIPIPHSHSVNAKVVYN